MADDNSVSVVFGANISGLVAGVEAVKGELEGLSGTVQGITSVFTGLGEVILATFAVEKIEGFVDKIVEAGVDLDRMEQQLGMSAQQINVLSFAAENSDTQISTLTRSMTQFALKAEEAQKGTGRAADAFHAMGINVKDFLANGGTLNQLFDEVTQKISTFNAGMEKSALVSAVMGGRSAQLVAALDEYGAHQEEINKIVQRSGITLEGFSDDAKDTNKKMLELEDASQGVGERLFTTFKPAIDAVVSGLAAMAEGFNDSFTNGGTLVYVLGTLEVALNSIITIIFAMIEVTRAFWEISATAYNSIAQVAISSFKAANDAAHLHFKEAGEELAKIPQNFAEQWKESGQDIISRTQKDVQTLKALWSNADAEPPKRGGTNAPNSAAESQKEIEDKIIQIHKDALDQQLADDNKNIQAKIQAWTNYLNWLKVHYPDQTHLIAQANTEITKLNNQAVNQSEEKWDRFFKSFNSGIKGMLTGTKTWADFMRNAVTAVFTAWLEKIELVVAAQIAGDKSTAASGAAGSIKRIEADAAKAYSGVYGFLAPEIGPFAAIPAALAFASVAAMESLVPSFDVGSWNIPGDTMAMVHKGEMIIPAAQAEAIRGGGGAAGGGVNIHFNGPVYGQKDFQGAVAHAVAQASRSANPNLARAMK